MSLGTKATDPVVTLSALAALVTQLINQFNAHTHPAPGGATSVPAKPLALTPKGSTRVRAAP